MHKKTARKKICAGILLLFLTVRQVLASDMELGGFDIQMGVEGEDDFFWETDNGNSTDHSQMNGGGNAGDNQDGAGTDKGNDKGNMESDHNRENTGLDTGNSQENTGLDTGNSQGNTGLDTGNSQGGISQDAGNNKGSTGLDTGSNQGGTSQDAGSNKGSTGLDIGSSQGSNTLEDGSNQGSTSLDVGSNKGSTSLDVGSNKGGTGMDIGSNKGSTGLDAGSSGSTGKYKRIQRTTIVSPKKDTATSKSIVMEKQRSFSDSPTKGAANDKQISTEKKKTTVQTSSANTSESAAGREEADDLQTEQVSENQTKELIVWKMEYESAGGKEAPRIQVQSCEGVHILSMRWNHAEVSWYWKDGEIWPVFVPEKGNYTLEMLAVCEKGDYVKFCLSE